MRRLDICISLNALRMERLVSIDRFIIVSNFFNSTS